MLFVKLRWLCSVHPRRGRSCVPCAILGIFGLLNLYSGWRVYCAHLRLTTALRRVTSLPRFVSLLYQSFYPLSRPFFNFFGGTFVKQRSHRRSFVRLSLSRLTARLCGSYCVPLLYLYNILFRFICQPLFEVFFENFEGGSTPPPRAGFP